MRLFFASYRYHHRMDGTSVQPRKRSGPERQPQAWTNDPEYGRLLKRINRCTDKMDKNERFNPDEASEIAERLLDKTRNPHYYSKEAIARTAEAAWALKYAIAYAMNDLVEDGQEEREGALERIEDTSTILASWNPHAPLKKVLDKTLILARKILQRADKRDRDPLIECSGEFGL